MPRRARHFKPDSIFHVGARGVDRQPIFLTDADRKFFISSMKDALAETNIRSVAHCLMPNHFHWALAVKDEGFDRVLQSVMTRHAVRFNLLYGRTGHLFEGRHWSELCEDIGHIENAIAYIHLNPVRAKLVSHPSQWEWSSFSDWAQDGGSIDFARISAISGKDVADLKADHLAKIEAEVSGRPQGLDARAVVSDVASMLGVSLIRLLNGEKGELFTKAKRLMIERAARERISIAALARALGTDPESLYRVRMRTP